MDVSPFELNYRYSRNLYELCTSEKEYIGSNNNKETSEDLVFDSFSNISDSLKAFDRHQVNGILLHNNMDVDRMSDVSLYSCRLSELGEELYDYECQLNEEEIDVMINSLKPIPSKSDLLNIWRLVCRYENYKFLELINHFFSLYCSIKHKYHVKKGSFRKNIWENYNNVIKELPCTEAYYNERLNNYINEKSLTREEYKAFVEEYRNVVKELREDLFSRCQIEVAQVMELPQWKLA
ncbi:hypothetical protein MKS88_004750 [Plasmodium brasilianum]|uniref:Plasmodium RESA N-terminal domain-containing protein n=2 Tax=Plasmodium (Plasmodium) TaxID=418103 RepID=A0A1A8XA50_PLAMA|nr:Plasmodium exported protein, unknown function [Plasmodium malariae]KAI4835540.1 hypothetical protein MKS88_004750 [Plasmodium brasilianum]SBT00699.1 Plasmodium exported protein (PHIST), unknown function [Plasmodium malariae]SCP02462.1 Plasmodium exported protein, unknown function [Plasmodium malariae]